MPFPTDTILTAGTKLLLQKSIGNRTLPTITVTTTGAVAAGAITIPIAAVTSPVGIIPAYTAIGGEVVIQQGTKVTFNSTVPTTVVLANDLKVGDTAIVPTVPTATAIQSGNTATANGLLQLLGAEDSSMTVNESVVPTKSFESGFFSEERKTGIGGQISVSGFIRRGDPCFNQVVLPNVLGTDEIYCKIVYPDLNFRAGFAFVKGFSESNKVMDIRKFKFDLFMLGEFTTGVEPA